MGWGWGSIGMLGSGAPPPAGSVISGASALGVPATGLPGAGCGEDEPAQPAPEAQTIVTTIEDSQIDCGCKR